MTEWFIESNGPPISIPDDLVPTKEIVQQIEDAEVRSLGPPSSKIREYWSSIPMSDGYENKCKVFQPATTPPEGSPLVVYFHGGGFTVGSPNQATTLGRAIAQELGAVCIAPAYRLLPNHAFPKSPLDAWDVIQFLATNAEANYGVDLARGFVVGGSSSGGNLAAVVAQLAKDRALSPPLTGQCLICPLIMWDGIVPAGYRPAYVSLKQNASAPIFATPSMNGIFKNYMPDIHSPYFSPLNNKAGHSGLPPAYIKACGLDCIRDDALIYNEILKEAGVETRLEVHPGLPHNFWAFVPSLKVSLKANTEILQGIGWLLNSTVDEERTKRFFSKNVTTSSISP